jgi:putative tricarboxylic transport membrane protein
MKRSSAAVRALGSVALAAAITFATHAHAWEPTEEVEFLSHAGTNSSTWAFMNAVVMGANEAHLLPHGARLTLVTGESGAKARNYLAIDHAGDPYYVGALTPSQVNNTLLCNCSVTADLFRGIAMMGVSMSLVVVNANSPYQSMDDLIKDAKARPGELVQGGGFIGTTMSLMSKSLEEAFGLQLTYVPFDDQGILQIVGGHVDFVITTPEQILKYVRAGKARILAASAKLDEFPDVPTFKEAGYEFPLVETFRGFWTSKDVPDDAVAFYVDMLKKVLETDAYKKFLESSQGSVNWISGKELDDYLTESVETYRRLNAALGLTKPT